MTKESFDIVKYSGEKVKFSADKLRASLKRSGVGDHAIQEIIDTVKEELYQGISTKEIYNRAFGLLKHKKSIFASKYKLKKAIYELGPTGFPFERFIASLLKYSGYETSVGVILQGKCVSHEVDVLAKKNGKKVVAECKFHSDQGNKCNVKVPLYINSRYRDILDNSSEEKDTMPPNEGWVVTNTRFTKDAIMYGSCAGLQLLSWDYPKNNSLKQRIDRLGLYPITVSTLLTNREKHFLLSRDIVLCRELLYDKFYLDHLGISEVRKEKILAEVSMLCNI